MPERGAAADGSAVLRKIRNSMFAKLLAWMSSMMVAKNLDILTPSTRRPIRRGGLEDEATRQKELDFRTGSMRAACSSKLGASARMKLRLRRMAAGLWDCAEF